MLKIYNYISKKIFNFPIFKSSEVRRRILLIRTKGYNNFLASPKSSFSFFKKATVNLLILPENETNFFFYNTFKYIACFVIFLFIFCMLYYFILSLLQIRSDIIMFNNTLTY